MHKLLSKLSSLLCRLGIHGWYDPCEDYKECYVCGHKYFWDRVA